MSQAFSLYTELTVRQNLELHAHLFDLPARRRGCAIEELLEHFGLRRAADTAGREPAARHAPTASLAVAVLHEPEVLILDEPTSGVDPVARDTSGQLLIDLSRNDGVTIFVSTHFMNEAERCDRISLMHAGRVLAQAPPPSSQPRPAPRRGGCVRAYISRTRRHRPAAAAASRWSQAPRRAHANGRGVQRRARLLAYTRREALEVRRDPVRLAFALLGPLLLMMIFGYGISFDVKNLPSRCSTRIGTPESRAYAGTSRARTISGSARPRRLRGARAALAQRRAAVAIEIPPDFGRDLQARALARGRRLGSMAPMPFRAEASRGYVQGRASGLSARARSPRSRPRAIPQSPANVEVALPLQPGLQERLCDGAR